MEVVGQLVESEEEVELLEKKDMERKRDSGSLRWYKNVVRMGNRLVGSSRVSYA